MGYICGNRRGTDGAPCVLSSGHSTPHDYDDRSFSRKDDSDPGDRFSDEERITANLRLQSVSPIGRTLLGVIAYLPPGWRGPVLLFAIALIGFLVGVKTPDVVHWIKDSFK